MKNKANQNTKYVDDIVEQVLKKGQTACGDYSICDRTPEGTTFILCDGIGSGIKANIAAVMCASRLMHLLKNDFSLYEACECVVESMHRARTEEIPYSVFTIARINVNGYYTVLSYEMPAPIIIEGSSAYLPEQRFFSLGYEIVGEINGSLNNRDAILLVSDGLPQAGLGQGFRVGWTIEGVLAYVNDCLGAEKVGRVMLKGLLGEAWHLSGKTYGDDTTAALLTCRNAKVLNIATGPPAEKSMDSDYSKNFMEQEGTKAICGSTTAELVSRNTNIGIKAMPIAASFSQPPMYEMDGIDLVSEGAITLNQLYNIIGEDIDQFDEFSCVTDLYELMYDADIIRFSLGCANNMDHGSIAFKQMGIMPRQKIVPLIAEELMRMGKLVVINRY